MVESLYVQRSLQEHTEIPSFEARKNVAGRKTETLVHPMYSSWCGDGNGDSYGACRKVLELDDENDN